MDGAFEMIYGRHDTDLAFIAAHVHKVGWHSLTLPELGDLKVNLVDETQQIGGSFKYRGAVLAVSRHPEGIVACGSGNFPIAVGLAAAKLGNQALLVMPSDAPTRKKEMARRTGAEVILVPRVEFSERAANEARERKWAMVHPFRDAEMLIGGCSLGREIAEQIVVRGSASDAVVVACGGGGLSAGVSLGLELGGASNRSVIVEPKNYPRLSAALAAGAPVGIEPSGATICDALRVTEIGELAFDTLKTRDVVVTTASDAAIVRAQQLMAERCQINAEPSGALALAAVLEGKLSELYDRVWVVVCGGNV